MGKLCTQNLILSISNYIILSFKPIPNINKVKYKYKIQKFNTHIQRKYKYKFHICHINSGITITIIVDFTKKVQTSALAKSKL